MKTPKWRKPFECPEGFISRKEAAHFLGITLHALHNWMKLKLIPYYKMGARTYFRREDLTDTILKNKVEANPSKPKTERTET